MRSVLFGFCTAGLCMIAPVAGADAGGGAERHLQGHGFLPSMYVADPFVSTRFENQTGAALSMGEETTFRDLDGNVLYTFDSDLVFAALGVGYQYRVAERVSIGARASGLARTGNDAQSFISEGADVDTRLHLWGRYRLLRSERDQVSAGLQASRASTLYITPREFARHIADGGSLADAPFTVTDTIWSAQLTAAWAHAFSAVWGIRVDGATGLYEVPRSSGVTSGTHRLGIIGEADVRHTRLGIPLGVTAGYTQNFPDNDPRTGPAGWLLGFWYNGREDFVVGIETGLMKIPVVEQDTDKVDAAFGIFMVQYYF